MSQDVSSSPSISISDMAVKVRHHFTYLGATIINNVALEKELMIKSPKVASKLGKRVWDNGQLTLLNKRKLFQTLNPIHFFTSGQGKRLERYHLRYLQQILVITWKLKFTNTCVGACELLEHVSSLLSMSSSTAGSRTSNECRLYTKRHFVI